MNYPKTRKEAKELGVTRYFTGLPCKHGHIALRVVKGGCIECLKIEWKQRNIARTEYYKAYGQSEAGKKAKRKYYDKNKELVIARASARSKEERAQHRKKYKQKNPGKYNALTAKRKAAKKLRTPKWLTKEDFKQMELIYIESQSKPGYQVDHIIPLQGKIVSGLHVPSNLQVISTFKNQSKNNKFNV